RADLRRARADAGPRRTRRHPRDALAPASRPSVRVGDAVRARWRRAPALPDQLDGDAHPEPPGRSAREPPRDPARPGPPATRIGRSARPRAPHPDRRGPRPAPPGAHRGPPPPPPPPPAAPPLAGLRPLP